MPKPISSIRNLGPATEEAFAKAGLHSAEDLYELGPDAAYLRLLQSGAQPHFIWYYVLVMGLQGRPWNDCKGAEKETLRRRFDQIKAQAAATPSKEKDRSRMEAVFNEIGLLPPKGAC